jgi:surface polysaccharide O-acyltransferase-like enzyme
LIERLKRSSNDISGSMNSLSWVAADCFIVFSGYVEPMLIYGQKRWQRVRCCLWFRLVGDIFLLSKKGEITLNGPSPNYCFSSHWA